MAINPDIDTAAAVYLVRIVLLWRRIPIGSSGVRRTLVFAYFLIGKRPPTPDPVQGRLFSGHARAMAL
jgi:hypothetical protein